MDKILQEMIEVLFLRNTILKAKELRNFDLNSSNLSYNGFDFRLLKAPAGNINLEVFLQDQFGNYYKPIGYYDFGTTNDILQICILNEFLEAFKQIYPNIDSDLSEKARTLNLLDNVFIALGSREVGNTVKEMFNSPNYSPYNHMDRTKFQVQNLLLNNLQVQVKTSMMGALEAIFVDNNDDFQEEYLIMFQNKDGISIHCSENTYNKMNNRSLLSIFK
ncbi:MAG: hypothetical protein J0L47_10670 [Flavobacteriales bacterium]|jgi:hypothetical protein|nr:hypothetical protein [Flavobacteriales bacterium]